MTKDQEIRTAKDREFSLFGASRFPLYMVAGFALYAGQPQIAGICIMVGAAIEIARRFYYKFKD